MFAVEVYVHWDHTNIYIHVLFKCITGKNVHFLSLRDLMEYARKIQAHTPPGQPTMSQKLMGLLKQGVGRMLFG